MGLDVLGQYKLVYVETATIDNRMLKRDVSQLMPNKIQIVDNRLNYVGEARFESSDFFKTFKMKVYLTEKIANSFLTKTVSIAFYIRSGGTAEFDREGELMRFQLQHLILNIN